MKIKITNCSAGFNWFNNHLGEVFEVDYRTPGLYWVIVPKCGVCGVPDYNCIELPELVTLMPDSLCKVANRLAQPIPVDLADRLIELSKPNFPSWTDLEYDFRTSERTALDLKVRTCRKLLIAADWVNDGWKPDVRNPNQFKATIYYSAAQNKLLSGSWMGSDNIAYFKSFVAAGEVIDLFRANGDEQDLINLLTS
jgi:hypothetical protein